MTTIAMATGISLAGLWWILHWLYRDYKVDQFRQRMFAVRDDLFDFAASGSISFQHPAYRMLRFLINGYIRFGHRISILPVFLTYLRLDEEEKEWLEEHSISEVWQNSTNDLPVPTVRALGEFQKRADELIQQQLILGSPFFVATIVPTVVLIVAVWLPIKTAKIVFLRVKEGIDLAAYELGKVA